MLGRTIALLLWAVTLAAGSADAAETMFATLDVKRLNWRSDEIIYEGRLAVRGASVVSAQSILGGELVCDSTGYDHWFHFPLAIRGSMPDKGDAHGASVFAASLLVVAIHAVAEAERCGGLRLGQSQPIWPRHQLCRGHGPKI